MIILTPIQEYSFLANLDRILIQHIGTDPVVVEIKHEGIRIYSGKIYSNEKGEGVLVDLAGILEPYVYHKLVGDFSFSFSVGSKTENRTSKVFYSKVKVDLPAYSFLENYFLSLSQTTRSILPTHQNYLHLYAAEKCTIKAILNYGSGTEGKVLEVLGDSDLNKLITLDVSPLKFEKLGEKLLSYKITAGNRKAEYSVDWIAPDRGLQFVFTNSFGVQEIFHTKGEHTLEKDITRSSGIFSGLDENYDLREVHTHKVFTGYMSKSLSLYATDFIRSNEVYLVRSGMQNKPIRIKESKIKDSADDADLRNYELEFVPAEINHNVLEFRECGRIFDHTFDNTFN